MENQLHWVKNVICQADKSPLHPFWSVTNFSILKGYCYEFFPILEISIRNGKSKMAPQEVLAVDDFARMKQPSRS